MQVNWTKMLWNKGEHNAFTDLCQFRQRLFCCFREANNHISGDGVIRVIELDQSGVVRKNNTHCLSLPQADIRDPKLSVTPDDKLMLIAYARHIDEASNSRWSHPVCWFSTDGYSWSTMRYFGDRNWWLWRVTWHNNDAYGFAYNRSAQAVNLYKGDPRRTFHLSREHALSLTRHGLGYPNESDILFNQNDHAFALIRRDADSCTAQLGTSSPPYTQWKWHDLGEYIGGPAMVKISDCKAIVAGRLWRQGAVKTALWTLDLNTKKLSLPLILPSSGDTSYPGLVLMGKTLLVSYYSSHVDKKSNIFLASITL